MTMTHRPYHFVAVVGGAIAGSVAAEIFADNGIHVLVIEQNKTPEAWCATRIIACLEDLELSSRPERGPGVI
jgi:flavin-dependent dehydrogenase